MIETLCFPLMGCPTSGKTSWHATVYSEISQGICPAADNISHAGGGHYDNRGNPCEIDPYEEQLIRPFPKPGHAFGQEPYSVMRYEFTDSSGRARAMVNITEGGSFDCTGPSFIRWIKGAFRSFFRTGLFRKGHLFHVESGYDVQGVVLFLDPTLPSETLAKDLQKFRDLLGSLRQRVPEVPVALCVNKIDLLVNQPYGEGGNIDSFFSRLGEIGETFSLDAINERSKLVAQLTDTIWPGWHIEREIDSLFGGRHLFFPMSQFRPDNIGETDLAKIRVNPFGVHEPIFWLLHMTGHSVF